MNRIAGPNDILYNGRPGRFLFAPRAQVDALSANLRVHDVSRRELNFGTEIPVVRERDFRYGRITLLGVPADPRFRKTLRVYGVGAPYVRVSVDHEFITVPVSPGTIHEPAYAEISEFPAGASAGKETFDVSIDRAPGPYPPPRESAIWAFITVTNNETQHITTITPQP